MADPFAAFEGRYGRQSGGGGDVWEDFGRRFTVARIDPGKTQKAGGLNRMNEQQLATLGYKPQDIADWNDLPERQQKKVEKTLMDVIGNVSPTLKEGYKPGSLTEKFPRTNVQDMDLSKFSNLNKAFNQGAADTFRGAREGTQHFAEDFIKNNMLGITQGSGEVTEQDIARDPEKYRDYGRTGQSKYFAPKAKSTAQQAGQLANTAMFYGTLGSGGLAKLGSTPFQKVAISAGEEGLQNVISGAASRYGETGQAKDAFDLGAIAGDFGMGAAFGGAVGARGARQLSKANKTIDNFTSQTRLLDEINSLAAGAKTVNKAKTLNDTLQIEAPKTRGVQGEGFTMGDPEPVLASASRRLKQIEYDLPRTKDPEQFRVLKQERENITQAIQDGDIESLRRADPSMRYAEDFKPGKTSTAAPEAPRTVVPREPLTPAPQSGKLGKVITNIRKGVIDDLTEVKKAFKGQTDKASGLKVADVIDEKVGGVRRSDSVAEAELRSNQAWQELGELLRGKGRQKVARKEAKEIATFISEKQDAINRNKLGENVEIPVGTAKQEQAYALLNKSTKSVVERAYKAGLIDEAKYRQWMADPDYTRVQREIDEYVSPPGSRRSPEGSLASTITKQKLKGSDKAALDPFASFVDWNRKITTEIQRNDLATYLTGQLEKSGMGRLTTAPNVSERSIARFRNGVKELVETDPAIASAIKDMDQITFGALEKYATAPGRLLRAGATGMNVAFTVPNFIKDQMTSFVLSKNVMATHNPLRFLEGLWESSKYALKGDKAHMSKDFELFLKHNKSMTQADLYRDLRKASNEAYESLGLKRGSALRKYEDLISSTEYSTRYQNWLGTYKKALKNNDSPEIALQKANLAARRNSVDFSSHGEMSTFMRLFNPYINASIQGSRSLARAFKEQPIKTSAKIATTVLAPVAGLTYWNLADPERAKIYANMNEWDRENNMIFVLDGGKGILKLPLPEGIKQFAKPVRSMIEAQYIGDKPSYLEMAKNWLVDPFSPIGTSANELLSSAIPQAIKPVVETAINRDLYTGKEIIPKQLLGEEKDKQAFEGTSQLYRDLANILKVSPLQVQKIVKGYTAGGGEGLVESIDKLRGMAGQDVATGKRSTPEQLTNRFYQKEGNNAVQSKFYETYNPLKEQASSLSDTIGIGRSKGVSYQDAKSKQDNFNEKVEAQKNDYLRKYGNALTQEEKDKYSKMMDYIKIDTKQYKKKEGYYVSKY